jgi:DNA-binding transcriptional LysR family regulator
MIMLSLRQVEALVWVAQLGTFERAAARLNTTQSAISKRMNELEATVGFALFDRSQRGSKLTQRGEEVLEIARKMLELRDEVAAIKSGSRARIQRRVRIGVTELTAITWLPQLIFAIQERHPGITIDLEVSSSRTLYESLQSGQLDIIVCPDVFNETNVKTVHLAKVDFGWMEKPGFTGQGRVLPVQELVSYPLLLQGGRSGAGSHLAKWLLSERLVFERVLITDSLMAVVGMTVSGLGISHLPRLCFKHLIDDGRLRIIETKPLLPEIPYLAIFRQDHPSQFIGALAELMRELCDFSKGLAKP